MSPADTTHIELPYNGIHYTLRSLLEPLTCVGISHALIFSTLSNAR